MDGGRGRGSQIGSGEPLPELDILRTSATPCFLGNCFVVWSFAEKVCDVSAPNRVCDRGVMIELRRARRAISSLQAAGLAHVSSARAAIELPYNNSCISSITGRRLEWF